MLNNDQIFEVMSQMRMLDKDMRKQEFGGELVVRISYNSGGIRNYGFVKEMKEKLAKVGK